MEPSTPQSSGEFDGSDFSNNLFTDLAPLLTLFGEQVTKQFLSQAMGFGDDILLAMASLGILTCVVSAIRVGGRKWLKALVGRARESRAVAEMEIMSSTSDAVCELWSGTEIVRERGQPKMKEFLFRPITTETELNKAFDSKIVYDLRTACEEGILTVEDHARLFSRLRPLLLPKQTRAVKYATRLMQQAPNLTLNVTKAITSRAETWLFATLGIIIQLAVIVIASLVTYYWQLGENGSSSRMSGYGFPLFIIGSILLSVGVFLCSYIIEAITEETNFCLAENSKNTKVVCIQCACTVGDQHFGSYAITNEGDNTMIRTSRINKDLDFSLLSMIATGLSISGYLMQFVGLRAMHWSVAVTVLGATLIMACVRAYVRRGLAKTPRVKKLTEGRELTWLTMHALGLSSFELGAVETMQGSDTHDNSENAKKMTSAVARKAVETRKELTQLVPWQNESMAIAHQLAEAITKTLQFVVSNGKFVPDYEAMSTLVFERNDAGHLPAQKESELQSSSKPDTTPFLSCKVERYTSREEYDLNNSTPRGRSVRHRRQSPTLIEERLDDDNVDLVEIVEEYSGPEKRRAEWESMEAGGRERTAPQRYVESNKATAPKQEQLGTSNWFWENQNLIEEATLHNENKIPLGFTTYHFRGSEEEFGAGFKWEADVQLTGSPGGALSPLSQTTKYCWLARSIAQKSQDELLTEPERIARMIRARGHLSEDGFNTQNWTVDVGNLAAILSLFTLTSEAKPAYHPSRGAIRRIGCGWQVLVPAKPTVAREEKSKSKVHEWIQASQEDDLDAGQTGILDAPNLETDTSFVRAIPGQSPISGEPEFKTVDFFKVWIERKTVATPSEGDPKPDRIFDSYPRLSDYGPVFGSYLSSYSRVAALETFNTQAQHLRLDPTKSTSSKSEDKSSLAPNQPTALLSYMLPPKGTVTDKDSLAQSMNEEKVLRTYTPVPRLCAQEIFSAFLLQLVASLAYLEGDAKPRAALQGDGEDTLRWQHPALSQLAGIVRDSKLASDEEEAYMLIIPAFHAHGLLPKTLDEADKLDSGSYYTYSSYYSGSASKSSDRQSRVAEGGGYT